MKTPPKIAGSTGNLVGRGQPPKHSRFKKGQSGNPGGRPKGSKNLKTLIMSAANERVFANIEGRRRRISKLQATVMQLATKAAGGDQTAIARLLDWVDEFETRAAAARPSEFPLSEPDVEVIRAIYERMKQCEPPKSE